MWPAHICIAFHHALHPRSVAECCCYVACGFTPFFAAIILTVAIAKISGWGCVMWQDSHACENSSREFHLPVRWLQLSILRCTSYLQRRYFGHSAESSDEKQKRERAGTIIPYWAFLLVDWRLLSKPQATPQTPPTKTTKHRLSQLEPPLHTVSVGRMLYRIYIYIYFIILSTKGCPFFPLFLRNRSSKSESVGALPPS